MPQWHVFRHDEARDVISGGGDNYESSVNVDEIHTNPVPNFTFNRYELCYIVGLSKVNSKDDKDSCNIHRLWIDVNMFLKA